jgi:hypothetical protein
VRISLTALLLGLALPPLTAACGPKNDPKQPTAPTATPTANVEPPATYQPPTPLPPASKKAFEKRAVGYRDCLQGYKPGDGDKDLPGDLARLAKSCEAATKMHPIGDVLRGSQADSALPTTFPLNAQAGKCYRVYATTAAAIGGIDVAIKDSEGNVVASDPSEGLASVVGQDSVVCFKENDAATISVAVASGSGAFVVQLWGD